MTFWYIEPEVAGGPGERSRVDRSVHPPIVDHLHYAFDGWLGDVLVEGFPVFIIATEGEVALRRAGASGVSFDQAEITTSEQFAEIYPGRTLPPFVRLIPSGRAGQDDVGLAADLRMVISDRVLALLSPLGLAHAIVEPFGR